MKSEHPDYPPFESLLEQLDLDAVANAILTVRPGEPTMKDFDFEDAKSCVWTAAETWLPRDYVDIQVEGIEKRFRHNVSFSNIDHCYFALAPIKGYLDIYGKIIGKHPETNQYAGQGIVIDWKTSRQTLDKVWKERLINSWQWRIYATFNDVGLISYRGINRKGETEELCLVPPEDTSERVYQFLKTFDKQFQSMLPYDLWTQNKPSACGVYGRDCIRKYNCETGNENRGLVEIGEDFSYSYTTISNFMSCPELVRTMIREVGDVEDWTEDTLFGNAVHRGIAEVYSQMFNVEIEGRK